MQDDVVAAAQAPAPSHRRADVKVEPVQLPAAHCVPLMYLRQAPAPSHVPSLPQVDAAAIGHCDAVTGGLPAAIGVHVPRLVAIEQDMQVPAQALLQQMLLTQNPVAQSPPIPDGHGPPGGILPQLMFTQVLPDTQSAAELVHVILHAPVPQRYGVHGLMVAARHIPTPSQVLGDDSVDPVQLAAAQLVPAA
jgi:hypothetical protein